MRNKEISGTGNGISDSRKDDFLLALQDYSDLIVRITKYLKGNKSKWFDHKYHTITNWHGTYKIEVSSSEFPFSLANTFAVNCWGRLQVGIVFPLKFRAESFHGGETTDMSVSLVTDLFIDDLKVFASREDLPLELRQKALLELRDYYSRQREEKYRAKHEDSLKQIARLKAENARKAEEITRAENIEIPELEKRVKQIEKLITK